MTGYLQNIEEITLRNNHFREVLYTGQHTQLVVMSLNPEEEIGSEIHEIVDQFFRVESGEGKVIINNEEYSIKDGDVFIVPSKTEHNVINTSPDKSLKFYTLYSPPHHKDKTIHKTKQEAEADKEDHL